MENEQNNAEPRVWRPDKLREKVIADSEDHLLTSEDEFEKAFAIIERHPRRITFFGSARIGPEDRYYQLAYNLAGKLAAQGYAILSGGGGGIMEAANKGAYDARGASLGFNIILPHEQSLNNFTTEHMSFRYFFTRKVMMTFYAHAYVFFPGGFGTLDEFFEVLTLMQTHKMERAPLILVGNEFWGNLNRFVREDQLAAHTISPGDENIYTISEDIDALHRQIVSAIE